MPGVPTGSTPSGSAAKPKEGRRWLKPRVPREQLYRLAPRVPRPPRLGRVAFEERAAHVLRGWWAWLALAIACYWTDHRVYASLACVVSFLLYQSAVDTHPAVYPLNAGIDIQSAPFRTTLAGITGAPVVQGNDVTVYNNGDEFFPAMLSAIESATTSITMEQYIFWDGRVGRRFAEALSEKARQGVEVKLLLDAIGSSTLGRENYRILGAGGCQVAWFSPIHWYTLQRANHRNHRKSLIVDGRLAFTGGAGLADHWLGDAEDERGWRDVMIAVRGPAAGAMQTGFAQNWMMTTGEIISGDRYFPDVAAAGQVDVQTILSSPQGGAGAVGTLYMVALQCARHSLCIANPYFIPDSRVIELLSQAVARGVQVTILLAGRNNDAWWARQNSVRLYGRLLEAGVHLYEFEPTMLHQKVMIADDAWATVGTGNFDNRSFSLNEETSVCLHDGALVAAMAETFGRDLARARRIDLQTWRRRGVRQWLRERAAAVVEDEM